MHPNKPTTRTTKATRETTAPLDRPGPIRSVALDRRRPGDLGAIVHRGIAAIAETPEASVGAPAVSLAAAGPVLGWWDPERIHQLLRSLIANAIGCARGRPIEVRVDATPSGARILVGDRAPAIPRRRKTPKRSHRSIILRSRRCARFGKTRRLVRAMGGEVSVKRSRGWGAMFAVEFPLAAFAV
jgi:two-component system, OmpR family, sensor histidine kinase SenX3